MLRILKKTYCDFRFVYCLALYWGRTVHTDRTVAFGIPLADAPWWCCYDCSLVWCILVAEITRYFAADVILSEMFIPTIECTWCYSSEDKHWIVLKAPIQSFQLVGSYALTFIQVWTRSGRCTWHSSGASNLIGSMWTLRHSSRWCGIVAVCLDWQWHLLPQPGTV